MDEGRSSGVNISDVIEVIETDEMYAGAPSSNGELDSRRPRAYVKIIEQPASKALRFRYECEGRSAGSIPGVNSTPENKTYPGIQIVGHSGRAVVVVSCVTKDAPYRPHPHNLVGKEGCSRGICTLKMNSDTITFSNLGIQCVKKKDIEEALKVREEIRVDPFRTGFSHKNQPSSIDLNSVRLCFQVFLEGPKKEEYIIPLRPVVSDPIYDKKAMSDLTICKLSDCSASVVGGKEIILLCEKVAKEDIQIRFYEERDGDLLWEAYGDFQPTQVHKQVAISFRTPKYKSIDVEKPVKVWLQLRRPSDGAVSESVPFQFVPLDSGRATFWSLHGALAKKGNYNTFSKILDENALRMQLDTQKRKLDSEASFSLNGNGKMNKPSVDDFDFENRKDSLISGGNLVVVPNSNGIDRPSETKFSSIRKEERTVKPVAMEVTEDHSKIGESSDIIMENNINKMEKKINIFGPAEKSKIIKATEFSENSQSFNDLISQVAELDEIYAETREKLTLTQGNLGGHLVDSNLDSRESVPDTAIYSSMQLAMKNPLEPTESRAYEDLPNVRSPLINLAGNTKAPDVDKERLPPLPPKRVKKTPPRRPEESSLTKSLPKTPEAVKTKQNLFQKLFSKNKGAVNNTKVKDSQSAESLKSHANPKSTNSAYEDVKSGCDLKEVKDDNKSVEKWFHKIDSISRNLSESSLSSKRKIIEDLEKVEEKLDKENENYNFGKDDLESGLDLTEAENYALYTSIAPHASISELDEISFYYSPVEKGKILSVNEEVGARLRQIELDNPAT